MSPISGITARQTTPGDDPARVRDAARQFEALLLSQILKAAREGDDSEDPAGGMAIEMANEHFAETISRSGGLGLADMITRHLATPR